MSAEPKLHLLMPLLTRILGHRPSPATVVRWHKHGIKAGDQRVRLRVKRVGAKLYSTPEDVAEFIAGQNSTVADSTDEPGGPRDESTTRRLEEAGLL